MDGDPEDATQDFSCGDQVGTDPPIDDSSQEPTEFNTDGLGTADEPETVVVFDDSSRSQASFSTDDLTSFTGVALDDHYEVERLSQESASTPMTEQKQTTTLALKEVATMNGEHLKANAQHLLYKDQVRINPLPTEYLQEEEIGMNEPNTDEELGALSVDTPIPTVQAEAVSTVSTRTQLIAAIAIDDDPQFAQLRQEAKEAENIRRRAEVMETHMHLRVRQMKWCLVVAFSVSTLVSISTIASIFVPRESTTAAKSTIQTTTTPTFAPTIASPTSSPTPFSDCVGFRMGVSSIEFSSVLLRVVGTLPSCLGQLTQLSSIRLEGSEEGQLGLTIPTQLGLLTTLTRLMLSGNELTGTIPTELGRLTDLVNLGLSENFLAGTLPTELALLTNLAALGLDSNNLAGPVPSQLGQLTALSRLNLTENHFEGAMPTEMGLLTNLDSLAVRTNNLAGHVPTHLGALTALTLLDLIENRFVGTIPTEIFLLTKLAQLALGNNKLTGLLPTQLGELTSLSLLNLFENQFVGTLHKHGIP